MLLISSLKMESRSSSSSSFSGKTPALSSTSCDTRMGQVIRTASAIASLGRESISTSLPFTARNNRAKKTSFVNDVTWIFFRRISALCKMFASRSCVIGRSLVYRAFFALPSLTDRDGKMVNAAYGFTSMLLLALQEHPDYVLASFDLGGRTFRHEELAQYKATRRPTPPELSPQFPLTRDIVRAFGIPIYEIQGVEADDVIGTLARQAREQGLHSTIVTGDLDALQLVNDDVFVLTSKRGVSETVLYTPDRVRERYGLEPIQTVDLKGLVGDVSDNIPGIRGIGEKTAIKLIQEFGSV